MNDHPNIVMEACQPYPNPSTKALLAARTSDEANYESVHRAAVWRLGIYAKLSRDELCQLVSTLVTVNPRAFEQRLLTIQQNRQDRKYDR